MNRNLFKIILTVGLVAAVIGGLIFAYVEMSAERARERQREKPVVAESRLARSPTGETVVKLDEETRERIGLVVEPLQAASLPQEAKGYGRVLDPAPLLALFNELASTRLAAQVSSREIERVKSVREAELAAAQSAFNASSEELSRLKKLREQDNASLRAVQAAEAAAQRDRLQLETQKAASDRALQTAEANAQRDQLQTAAVWNKLALATGKAFAGRDDLPVLIPQMAAGEAALVRLDLPGGEPLPAMPTGARVVPIGEASAPLAVELIGPATGIDPQTQGRGFLFLAKDGVASLAPNASVTGFLKLPGAPLKGVNVPRAAVVHHTGGAAVYVQTNEDAFARRPVTLDRPTESGWFVAEGFQAGERVIVRGAQTVLSEELKAGIRMKD